MLTIECFFKDFKDEQTTNPMRTQDLMRKAREMALSFKSGVGEFLSGRDTMANKYANAMTLPNRNEGCFSLLELRKLSKNQQDSFLKSFSPGELPIYYGYQGRVKFFKYFIHLKWLKRDYFVDPYLGRTIKNYDGFFPIRHEWAEKICTLAEGERVIINGLKENDKSFVQHDPLPIGKENLLVKIQDAKEFIVKHPQLFRKRANIEQVFISWGRPLEISSQTEQDLLKAMAVILKDAYEGKPGFVIGKNKMNASAVARHVLKNLPDEYSRQGIELETIRKLIPRAMAMLEENKIVKNKN
jgi:hypothetical protein